MCGIAGKIAYNGTVQESSIKQMTDTIAHRGPDDAGIYIEPNQKIGLGHRRLSIIDTSIKGHQPMSYMDRYWIVFNGEIYNHNELRTQLQKNNYTFKSNTDTEVILALYDHRKEACVEHLLGMFAFAIYDQKKRTLFCARDRFGQKPFKYYTDTNTFIFASELKAILTQPEYKKEPDWHAIDQYLTFQYVPAPLTGFKGIKKLMPGTYLKLDTTTGIITTKKYWNLSFKPNNKKSQSRWEQEIAKELERATTSQMNADVPLGAFLSGGIDSSIIVGLMSKQSTNPINTFSIGFPEKKFNELSYARLVAKHFKTNHQEFTVTPNTVEILPELISLYEEPYADSSAIPSYYLSKLAKQHVTVALNGDGGDEHFAGYQRYSFHKIATTLDKLGISKIPLPAIPAFATKTTFGMRADRFLSSLSKPSATRYINYLCYFTDKMKENLYSKEFSTNITNSTNQLMAEQFKNAQSNNDIAKALFADISTYLPDDLLVKTDIATMSQGLEARSPFLDHKFAELTAQIPSHYKLQGLTDYKHILKNTFKHMLPTEITNRKKMGFILPIEKWFRDDLSSYLKGELLQKHTHITKHLCNPDAIKNLIERHQNTSANLAPPIWALLTLELWFKKYFS